MVRRVINVVAVAGGLTYEVSLAWAFSVGEWGGLQVSYLCRAFTWWPFHVHVQYTHESETLISPCKGRAPCRGHCLFHRRGDEVREVLVFGHDEVRMYACEQYLPPFRSPFRYSFLVAFRAEPRYISLFSQCIFVFPSLFFLLLLLFLSRVLCACVRSC